MTYLLPAVLCLLAAYGGYVLGHRAAAVTCDRCAYAYDDHDTPPEPQELPAASLVVAPPTAEPNAKLEPAVVLDDDPSNIDGLRPKEREAKPYERGPRPVNIDGAKPHGKGRLPRR